MSDGLFTLAQAASWIEGARVVGAGNNPVPRVHTDSRSVLTDDLFVALAGERFDGHDFLSSLPALGVKAAMARHGLASAGLSVPAAGAEAPPEPPRKSVTYQPDPFS